MLKNVLVLLVLLALIVPVFSIRLIVPESKVLVGNDFVGKTFPGATVELIFAKENNKYSSIEVLGVSPAGFEWSSKPELESLRLYLIIPKDTVNQTKDYQLAFKKDDKIVDEVTVKLLIDNSLLSVALDNYSQEINTFSDVDYSFTFLNSSDSPVIFTITSDLPQGWASSKEFFVDARSFSTGKFSVNPKLEGSKVFSFTTTYSNKSVSFDDVTLLSKPTIESKVKSVFYGFPFYSFTLLPSYFLNGLITTFF